MSKSLKRVRRALEDAGEAAEFRTPGETRTAPQAAAAVGCNLDQIIKSLLFRGARSGDVHLFLTAGGNQVCPQKAAALACEALERADAALVRARTGFAIGGVAPVGLLHPVPVWADPRLLAFDLVWAAAGTPRDVFALQPARMIALAGATVAEFTQ